MWWLIPLIILLFILFLLFLKVRICLIFENELIVKVKVLFLNIPILPATPKKIKSKRFSVKKLKKEQDKLKQKEEKAIQKKAAKEKKKEKRKKEHEENNTPKKTLNEKIQGILELVRLVIDTVISPFGRYLKIEVLKMHIRIASDDPSKTAITYGAVSQSVAYIIEGLSNITNVDVKKSDSIDVFPDFFAEKSEAKINITLGLRVWHALSIGFKFAMGFLKNKISKASKNRSNKNDKENNKNQINNPQIQEEQNGQQTK